MRDNNSRTSSHTSIGHLHQCLLVERAASRDLNFIPHLVLLDKGIIPLYAGVIPPSSLPLSGKARRSRGMVNHVTRHSPFLERAASKVSLCWVTGSLPRLFWRLGLEVWTWLLPRYGYVDFMWWCHFACFLEMRWNTLKRRKGRFIFLYDGK